MYEGEGCQRRGTALHYAHIMEKELLQNGYKIFKELFDVRTKAGLPAGTMYHEALLEWRLSGALRWRENSVTRRSSGFLKRERVDVRDFITGAF